MKSISSIFLFLFLDKQFSISQIPWAYHIEAALIGLVVFLMAYYRMTHHVQLFSHERLNLVMGLIHRMQSSITVVHNLLEEVISDGYSENTTTKMKWATGYTSNLMESFQNIIAFERPKMRTQLDFVWKVTEIELYGYITSVINQCKAYAGSRQIDLVLTKKFDYVNCRIDETNMSIAIQSLLNKVIDSTPDAGCIDITLSRYTDNWELQISNSKRAVKHCKWGTLPVSTIFPCHCVGSIMTVSKIFRLYGGKITGRYRGKMVALRITAPIECRCDMKSRSELEDSGLRGGNISLDREIDIKRTQQNPNLAKMPLLYLAMTDRHLGGYLSWSLSSAFRVVVFNEPEQVITSCSKQNPDIVVVDEVVGGMYGEDLCSKIKSDITMYDIPVILLVASTDNDSYLIHLQCGADRVERRMVSTIRLRADIRKLIENRVAQKERMKKILANNFITGISGVQESDEKEFVENVNQCLAKNISTEGYTVDMLSADMGMSRTKFYNRLKKVTGKTPINYIFRYKMLTAGNLLVTQHYTVAEISTLLGFCDAKYFGRKFKEFYHMAPTQYLKNHLE